MKILCLSPHPDDIDISAGGSLAQWKEHQIKVITFCYEPGFDIVRKEQEKSLKILGVTDIVNCNFKNRCLNYFRQDILEILFNENKEFKPDLVLCPNSGDNHQDHKTVHDETLRAFKGCSILGYDSSWNNYAANMRYFVPLTTQEVLLKLKALSCFESQEKLRPRFFNEEYQFSILRVNGGKIKTNFAEVFEAIRVIEGIRNECSHPYVDNDFSLLCI